jgi:hypothetical protein
VKVDGEWNDSGRRIPNAKPRGGKIILETGRR